MNTLSLSWVDRLIPACRKTSWIPFQMPFWVPIWVFQPGPWTACRYSWWFRFRTANRPYFSSVVWVVLIAWLSSSSVLRAQLPSGRTASSACPNPFWCSARYRASAARTAVYSRGWTSSPGSQGESDEGCSTGRACASLWTPMVHWSWS